MNEAFYAYYIPIVFSRSYSHSFVAIEKVTFTSCVAGGVLHSIMQTKHTCQLGIIFFSPSPLLLSITTLHNLYSQVLYLTLSHTPVKLMYMKKLFLCHDAWGVLQNKCLRGELPL